MNAQTESHTRLHGRWLLITRLAWIVVVILAISLYVAAAPVAFNLLRTPCHAEPCASIFQSPVEAEITAQKLESLEFGAWDHTIKETVFELLTLGVALLLFLRCSDDWMALLASIMLATIFAVFSPSPMMLAETQPLWRLPRALVWAMGLASTVGLFYLFPNGRFVPHWTRWLALVLLLIIGAMTVAGAPFLAGFPIFIVALAIGAGFQIYRYRRISGPIQRQQTKWVVLGIIGMVLPMTIVFFFAFLNPSLNPLLNTEPISRQGNAIWSTMLTLGIIIPICFLPVTLAFSVLRYRLWDVDILINRTLVYGILTTGVVGLYGLAVGWSSLILRTQNDLLANVFAMLVIAFLFLPLRQRLQGLADRFVPVPRVEVSESIPLPLPQTKQAQRDAVIDNASNTALRGRWLLVARLIWAAVFLTLTAMYALGFLEVREALSTVCEEELCTLQEQIRHTDAGEQVVRSPGPPIGYSDRLRPDQVEALERFGLTLDQYGWLGALQIGLPVLAYLLIAAGLFWRRSDNLMVLFASIMVATIPIANEPLSFTLVVHRPAWEWVSRLIGIVALSCFLIFPLIFPNGRFVPRWTRWIMLYEVAGAVIIELFRNSILERPGARGFILLYLLISFGVGIYAQLYRYFRVASPVERQQLKWVIVGLVGFISISVAVLLPLDALITSWAAQMNPARALLLSVIPDTFFQVILLFIPTSIAISVLRYRLWDIDIIISRTLVYGALSASVVGLYVLIVGGFGLLFQTQSNLPGIIIALLSIAFLFQPLRQRFQNVVNRFVPVQNVIIRESISTPVPPIKQAQNAAVTDSAPNTILHGHWLIFARSAWVIIFLTLTAMYVSGFFAVRDVLSTACGEEPCSLREQIRRTDAGEQIVRSAGPPVGFADRLRPDQIEALETLGLTLDQYGWLGALQLGLPALILLLIAAGLFWWKTNDWMVLFASVMVATFPTHNMPLGFTLEMQQPAWEWVVNMLGMAALSCLLIFPLVFPTGQFIPRWTRWMALYAVAGAFIGAFLGSAILEVFDDNLGRYFIGIAVVIPFGIGVYAQLFRYFRVARPSERQQFKWVVVGMAGSLVIQFAVLIPLNALLTSPAVSADPARALVLSAIPDTLWQINNLFIAVTITFSILRYRLWDIDIFINRSLVYGALIVSIIGLYMLVVGVAGTLFQSMGNTLLAIIATGLIAVLFHPLRQRLQRGINRLMYGERDEPYTALSRLGRQLEVSLAPEAVLPTVVTAVREVFKLPYVAIYLQQDSHGYKIVAESASPSLRIENGRIRVPGMEREGRCIPLIHQGETLGYIVLGPRAPNEAFSSTDLHLLDDLVPQVGVAVHAVRLTADLQRSREQLVLAREEERRRLRRDLHDDLGPTLASLGLTAGTAADLIPSDPTKAAALVKELQTEIRATVGNIRRLVYDLRPPSLDELGLLAAVRERAEQYSHAPDGFQVTVDAPAELPALPAAVEVAAYRIVQEALENVSKHARARQCAIRFANQDGLQIEIRDDGSGLPPDITPGVGLRSMRERAEELGGSLTIESGTNGGTRLLACLPIGESNGSVARIDRR